jgi:hypothetical protein
LVVSLLAAGRYLFIYLFIFTGLAVSLLAAGHYQGPKQQLERNKEKKATDTHNNYNLTETTQRATRKQGKVPKARQRKTNRETPKQQLHTENPKLSPA